MRGRRGLLWYLRELLGENDYDKYVAHLARQHPGTPPPSRRDFERAKTHRLERAVSARCC
jgi:uncharacterized short protein YbdD (DUF466 family)